VTGKMNWGRSSRERRMWDRGVSNVADEKERFERDRAARLINISQSAKPPRPNPHKPKSGNGKTIIILGDGDACPRCGVPTQIREHDDLGEMQLRQRCYYTRWFCCMNKNCKTTIVVPERHKVMNPNVGSDTSSDKAKPTVMQPDPADPNERPPWE
jgi:hypothetical protein